MIIGGPGQLTAGTIPTFLLPIFLAGIGLSGLSGYSFTPAHSSLLQFLATALLPDALKSMLGPAVGESVSAIIGLVVFFALISYFFNDEPINALIAIFLVVAVHSLTQYLLMPLATMLLA